MASLQGNEQYSEKTHEEKVVPFLSYYFNQFLKTTCNTLRDTAFPVSDLLQEMLHIKSYLLKICIYDI